MINKLRVSVWLHEQGSVIARLTLAIALVVGLAWFPQTTYAQNASPNDFTGKEVCQVNSNTPCIFMSGVFGRKAYAHDYNTSNNERISILKDNICHGKDLVTVNPPCPFARGTGLNRRFKNLEILTVSRTARPHTYLYAPVNGGEAHQGSKQNKGAVWVGDAHNLDFELINVLNSDEASHTQHRTVPWELVYDGTVNDPLFLQAQTTDNEGQFWVKHP